MGKTLFNLTNNWKISLQFDLKHIHKVNFYPSDNNFTQALLVMLVTNMISAAFTISILFRLCTATTYYIFTPDLKRLCCPSTWYSTSCSIDVERSASSSPPSCPSAPSSAPTSSNVCSDNGSTNGSTNSCIACTCALPVPVHCLYQCHQVLYLVVNSLVLLLVKSRNACCTAAGAISCTALHYTALLHCHQSLHLCLHLCVRHCLHLLWQHCRMQPRIEHPPILSHYHQRLHLLHSTIMYTLTYSKG